MKKNLFDLTEQDMEKNLIWYFPMSEETDELTVSTYDSEMEENHLKIVAAYFISKENKKYIGYLYVSEYLSINDLKPVIIYGGENLNFWKGIRKPTLESLKKISLDFGENAFPFKYETLPNVLGFNAKGSIDGIYFLDEEKKICCLRP